MSARLDKTVEPFASEARSEPLIAVVQVKPAPLPATQAVRFAIGAPYGAFWYAE
jgi:hypothetical protein